MERMKEMFRLQMKLNNDTNGTCWLEGVTNKGKTINWNRCIRQESAELLDSFPWKHWKAIDAQPDLQNARIELVDIWHFIMSEVILQSSKYPENNDVRNDVIVEIFNIYNYWFNKENEKYTTEDILLQVEDLIFCTFENSVLDVVDCFFGACKMLDLDLEALYGLYIGKNALNIFRQTHGYKEGTYIKIWNGKEDNAVMQELLTHEIHTFDSLLEALEKQYPKGE